MVLSLLQKSNRNSFKKILLLKKRIQNGRRLYSQHDLHFQRSADKGFVELEMLLWTLVITVILGGFFQIHRTYMNQHLKLQKDFQNEWNNL